ncbi:hypothetical protein AMJ87_09885 [candidate division WOR_3 bacterium SM23_60]|uniref:Uncharacterized protein n=1 Tax=candidate division WOR_3 bacterium SM23_60 TaxID=1703780 RepID=A0A0S8GAS7_UNCW3|nr:MAG: hypothetical protein AMJ87_09885 [candidate division WOR_3 bacterium SM23_60]
MFDYGDCYSHHYDLVFHHHHRWYITVIIFFITAIDIFRTKTKTPWVEAHGALCNKYQNFR